jgi:hypothetical protein
MKWIIYVCGFLSLASAIFHMGFWKLFGWKSDLAKLSFANRGVMQILTVQIIFYFLFVSFICFVFPAELQNTKLGNVFLLGCSLFWVTRAVQQFIFLNENNSGTYIGAVIMIIPAVLFALPVFVG